jgi:hypothetical protein
MVLKCNLMVLRWKEDVCPFENKIRVVFDLKLDGMFALFKIILGDVSVIFP